METLEAHGILISMADVGAAWQNGYAERLIRTLKEEAIDLSEYRNYDEAYQQIGRFLDDVYMHKRIHSSLGYLTANSRIMRFAKTKILEASHARLFSCQSAKIVDIPTCRK